MFFFFKQKTAYEMRISDWSSDVCSSDLDLKNHILNRIREFELPDGKIAIIPDSWFSDYSNLYALTEGSKPRLKKHHIGLVQDYAGSNLAAVTIDRKLQSLVSFEKIEEIPLPLGFRGELRSYQQADRKRHV